MPLMLLTATTLMLHAANDAGWHTWRGSDTTGYAPDSNPPVTWSETDNISWKIEIPGEGYASPIVLDDTIFITSAVPQASPGGTVSPVAHQPGRRGRGGGGAPSTLYDFHVYAIDRHDGSITWDTVVRKEKPHEGKHGTATYASNSPVTDGEHIFAHFGSRGLYCLDLKGNVVWETDLGDMRTRNEFGEGASPAVHEDTLVVPWDHEGQSFVVALDKRTGKEKWRRDREEDTNWASPAITEVNGRAQAILPGRNTCISYDLETGDEVWRSGGLTLNAIPSPIIAHGNVYMMSGFRGSQIRVVRLADAKGDVTGTDAIVWEHSRGTPYVPSPMLAGKYLYFLGSNSGILSCFDALTGESYYSGKRLRDVPNVYSSIVGAGDHVYVCGREGSIAVMKNGPEFDQIATNHIEDGINASPAIVGDVMYLRSNTKLYCIGEPNGG